MRVKPWMVVVATIFALFAWLVAVATRFGVTEEQFKESAIIEEETAIVGVNITLHQKIVDSVTGGGSVTYRYHLDTDCDHWSYHSAYESDRPLSLSDHMALEGHAHEIKVIYDGMAYAKDQYFELPSIGKTTNNETLEEFEARLTNEAWETFEAKRNDQFYRYLAAAALMAGLAFVGIWICRNRLKRTEL